VPTGGRESGPCRRVAPRLGPTQMILRDLLKVLGSHRRDGRNLSQAESYRAFATVLDGAESEIQVGAFLIALRWKGVTCEELVGFAQAARERARIPCVGMPGLVTLCPPQDGVDLHPPLEVASAFIAAGAGAKVLIVTDRCVPPRRGLTAASVFEYLRCGLTWDPSEAEDWVGRYGVAAISACGMLPGLLGLRNVRKDVGVRTPLSTVEKLIAPPSGAIVIGAQSGPVLGTAVEVMQALGHPSGMAIQGLEGSVVPTLRKRSRGIHLDGRHQVPMTIAPADLGLDCTEDPELPLFGPPEAEDEGTADNPALVLASGEMVLGVLSGQSGPARSAAVLTAAVCLRAMGRAMTFAEGVVRLKESV
jgi:anthranilate phosphoribosyltransferase